MHRKRKFGRMYETFADDIFRYLYVHVRDRHVAEDLTADTFVRAWKASERFDFQQPRPWLYKIARNLLTDHWRKRRDSSLEEPDEAADDDSLPETVDRVLTAERVQRAVGQLPVQMGEVVRMRFMLGYSAKQTAEALGISESNVRIIQYRALKKMRGYL